MNSETFIPLAIRTEAPATSVLRNWLDAPEHVRLAHVCLGLQTEIYEIEFEVVGPENYNGSMLEEIGDLLWYCAIAWDFLLPLYDVNDALGMTPAQKDEWERFWPQDDWNKPTDDDSCLLFLRREIGIFAEVAKPVLFYGRHATKTGLKSSLLLHAALEKIELYAAELLHVTEGKTLDEARARVIEKLTKRYPEKFTEQAANERADKAS